MACNPKAPGILPRGDGGTQRTTGFRGGGRDLCARIEKQGARARAAFSLSSDRPLSGRGDPGHRTILHLGQLAAVLLLRQGLLDGASADETTQVKLGSGSSPPLLDDVAYQLLLHVRAGRGGGACQDRLPVQRAQEMHGAHHHSH